MLHSGRLSQSPNHFNSVFKILETFLDLMFQRFDLCNDYFRFFVLDFIVLDLFVARDGKIVTVLLDLADWDKEAFAFLVGGILDLPVVIVPDNIRDTPLPSMNVRLSSSE